MQCDCRTIGSISSKGPEAFLAMEIGHYKMSAEGVLAPCDPDEANRLMADEDSRMLSQARIGDSLISTAFLPICLTFEDGRPQAFETVIVQGHKSVVVARYSDLAEAYRGHDQEVAKIKAREVQ